MRGFRSPQDGLCRYLLRRKLLEQSLRTNLDKVWVRVLSGRVILSCSVPWDIYHFSRRFTSTCEAKCWRNKVEWHYFYMCLQLLLFRPRIGLKSAQTVWHSRTPCMEDIFRRFQAHCFKVISNNCRLKQIGDMLTVWEVDSLPLTHLH